MLAQGRGRSNGEGRAWPDRISSNRNGRGDLEGSCSGTAEEATQRGRKCFLQWLKPIGPKRFTPGLKPRPPKERTFSAACESVPSRESSFIRNREMQSILEAYGRGVGSKTALRFSLLDLGSSRVRMKSGWPGDLRRMAWGPAGSFRVAGALPWNLPST